MTTQYNVPVKVLDAAKEHFVQTALQGYGCFTDRSGNLDGTCFSRENLPYAGEFIVVKTIRKEAAETAYRVLSGIEGLLVMPISECSLEEDIERVEKARQERH